MWSSMSFSPSDYKNAGKNKCFHTSQYNHHYNYLSLFFSNSLSFYIYFSRILFVYFFSFCNSVSVYWKCFFSFTLILIFFPIHFGNLFMFQSIYIWTVSIKVPMCYILCTDKKKAELIIIKRNFHQDKIQIYMTLFFMGVWLRVWHYVNEGRKAFEFTPG